MRPRELTLHGFRSYRTPTTFDFRDRRLVGIVGPIGAGKSSILDAIVFALYGKTPTFERDTGTLIHQLADAAHVSFTFQVGDQTWRAQRALRRTGQPGHKLERLADDEPGAAVLEAIDKKKGTQDKVAELLGMDFDAFCRSVLLAQNRFSDFLKATGGARDAVLKGVFRYERFDAALQVTKLRVAEADGLLAGFEEQGRRLGEAREALPAAAERAEAAEAEAAAFAQARPQIESLTETHSAAAADARVARERLDALAAATEKLPPASTIEAFLAAALAAADGEQRAVEARDGAQAALAAAQEIRDDRARDAEEMRAFEDLVKAKEREARAVVEATGRRDAALAEREEAEAALTVARQEATQQETSLADAERALADAVAARNAAEAALETATHAEMAIELRGHLEEGSPCPVCTQLVATVPTRGRAPATTKARKIVATAREAEERKNRTSDGHRQSLATARERVRGAEALLARVRPEVDAAESGLAEADRTLAETKDLILQRLGDGEDPSNAIARVRDELDAAEERLRSAMALADERRNELEEARLRSRDATTEVTKLGAALVGLWGLLAEARDPVSDPDEIRATYEELADTIRTRTAEAEELARSAISALERTASELAEQLARLGLEPAADFIGALAAASARSAEAATKVAELRATVEAGADLDARIADATASRDLAQRLVRELQPRNFLNWLLTEERRALAELGSHHLEELTDGAYRFTDDDAFDVVDVNAASTQRPADSLSGGETFLASLALALALAEMVARGGGRLDSFFLDEGFGSLDPEHLDRAMDGIARLVAGDTDRLVVLVSHVDQMRQTLEDLIVLDKDPRTGDTIVLSGASGESLAV